MQRPKHPISEILNRGQENAIPKMQLMKYYGLTERELYSQIERERLAGIPILSRKNEGGGFYLPGTQAEITEYLEMLKRGIDSQINVYNAIQNSPLSQLNPIG